MTDASFFRLAPVNMTHADFLYQRLRQKILTVLPAHADIQHIGATSVPGAFGKGDIDCCVRVRQKDFTGCDAALALHFRRNDGSPHTEAFAAFTDGDCVGIQLVAMGSPYDRFTVFRDLLLGDGELLARYNRLKQVHNGAAMEDYRKAKAAFIEAALTAHMPKPYARDRGNPA